MICPKCKSQNVTTQVVAEQKKRGCLMSCLWIISGLWLIPLISKKGSKTKTYAVCQDCGHRWKVKS